ncbi:MAG: hypothetical protein JWQ97_3716 [Phenylobacterium sp.]|nr:hypothetical protein [Phenylobacterium sp.]
MSAPLTPPDCDLQDYPFMPLHVARLRDSDLAAEEDPEACWYAVLLWAASWHQLPAASLPDNDAVLTKLIGLGRDLKTFRKHKAGALRGFVLCDDGRLYHPIVAEQALAGWRGKLEQRWRTECAKIKKRNQRDDTKIPLPTFAEFMATLPETSRLLIVPGDIEIRPEGQAATSPGTEGSCPQGNGIQEKGKGTGTGTGTGNLFEDADASPVGGGPTDPVREAFEAYNSMAGRLGLPIAKTLDKSRRGAIAGRLKDGGPEAWGAALDAVSRSDHCRGVNDRGWKADLDFVCQPKSWRRLLEGSYGGAEIPAQSSAAPVAWGGPADVLAAITGHQPVDWAVFHLSKCRWDAETRTLTGPVASVLMLKQEAGSSLAGIGVKIAAEDGRAA